MGHSLSDARMPSQMQVLDIEDSHQVAVVFCGLHGHAIDLLSGRCVRRPGQPIEEPQQRTHQAYDDGDYVWVVLNETASYPSDRRAGHCGAVRAQPGGRQMVSNALLRDPLPLSPGASPHSSLAARSGHRSVGRWGWARIGSERTPLPWGPEATTCCSS